MKINKLGISILGVELYIPDGTGKKESIKQRILEMSRAYKKFKTEESVPKEWRGGNPLTDLFNINLY